MIIFLASPRRGVPGRRGGSNHRRGRRRRRRMSLQSSPVDDRERRRATDSGECKYVNATYRHGSPPYTAPAQRWRFNGGRKHVPRGPCGGASAGASPAGEGPAVRDQRKIGRKIGAAIACWTLSCYGLSGQF